MIIRRRLAEVHAAQARATRARGLFAAPASTLLVRARRRPLRWIALAAGSGFVMGRLGWRVWRAPGVMALLSGGAVDLARDLLATLHAAEPPA